MTGWKGERGTSTERGYGTAWRKLRDRTMGRDHWLCQPCKRKGKVTAATECDHIIPKAQGGTDDPANLQAICGECHKAKSKVEASAARGYRARQQIGPDGWPVDDGIVRWGYSIPDNVQRSRIPVILISGPPAAGKTTYAREAAMPGDRVIDLDDYKVQAGGDRRDARWDIIRQALALRNRDIYSLSAAESGRCFLIVTAPTQKERAKWCEALGNVTVVLIRTPADVCIQRIKDDPDRRAVADRQIEAVLNWWHHN